MIKNYTLKALQKAINFALSLDETRLAAIHRLQGQVLQVVIKPLNTRFFICFTDNKLRLHAGYDGVVHATIYSSPIGLIRLSVLPASKVRSLFNDRIKITGDVALGQAIKKLFDELDIDWEGYLAQFTGDVVAYQFGSMFRQGRAFQQRLRQSLRNGLTEFVQEEARLFPPREEVDDFFQDIAQLHLQVERLAAQLRQVVYLK